MTGWVKICGLTSVSDARAAVACGADAVGLNFCPTSPRQVSLDVAREISLQVRASAEVVGVFVNAPLIEVLRVAEEVGLSSAQLHGDEPPSFVQSLCEAGVTAFKAARISSREDVAQAFDFAGPRLLVDAKGEGAYGGTGQVFDWSLIEELNQARELILAGGLRPENVAAAIRRVRPYGVDTASGVESSPGQKDLEKISTFVTEARRAFQAF